MIQEKKSCWGQFIDAYTGTPYKINWKNKKLGQFWFSTSLNTPPKGYRGDTMVIMGVEGITKGWQMDISKFNPDNLWLTYEMANQIVEELYVYQNKAIEEQLLDHNPKMSEKDIKKANQLRDLFYENPWLMTGQREVIYENQLGFLA